MMARMVVFVAEVREHRPPWFRPWLRRKGEVRLLVKTANPDVYDFWLSEGDTLSIIPSEPSRSLTLITESPEQEDHA